MSVGSVSIVNLPGNTASVYHRLVLENAQPKLACSAADVRSADRIILPGVGAFDAALRHLKANGLGEALEEAVRVRQRPILGICLGMHLMFEGSEEGSLPGLGWIPGRAERLEGDTGAGQKVPYFGWRWLAVHRAGSLLRGVGANDRFYFAHSYCPYDAPGAGVLARTGLSREFVAALELGNIFATQFHPERSHGSGGTVLRNFLAA